MSNRSLKEYAIQLKGIVESLKLGDGISKKQIEFLYEKLDEFTNKIDIFLDTDYWPSNDDSIEKESPKTTKPIGPIDDDLPF